MLHEHVLEREQWLHLALEGGGLGMWSFDVATGAFDSTPLNNILFGLPHEAPRRNREDWFSLVHPEDRDSVVRAWTQCLENGSFYNAEYRVIWPDGSLHWLNSRGRLYTDEQGARLRVLGVTMDLTARKHAEDALRESEARLRLVLDGVQAGVWQVTFEPRSTYWSPEFRALYGFSQDQPARDEDWEARVCPQDLVRIRESIQTAMELGRDGWREEFRISHPQLGERWIFSLVRLQRNSSGSVIGLSGINLDVTDRKRAEEALRDSESRLRLALEATGTGLWTWDPLTDAVTWSPECYRIHGLAESAFNGTGAAFFELVHPDDRARVEATVRAAIASGDLYECDFRIVRPTGEVVWVANRGRARSDERGLIRMIGTITDNTARKQAEEALLESEERYRQLFESNPHPMWVYDSDTLRFLDVNDAAIARYGYTREEFCRMTILDIRPVEEIGRTVQKAASVRGTRFVNSGIWKHSKKDGAVIDVEITSHAVDWAGHSARLVLAQDITARKRAEQALAESEARFRAIFHQAAAGIVLADISGRIVQANNRFCQLTGYSQEHLRGRHFKDITHPLDVPGNLELFERVLNTTQPIVTEKRYVRPDGSLVWVNSSVAAVRDAAGETLHALVVVQDISERKRAEAALADADRRKDDFIATLAHELRNPLAPIRTAVQVMQRSADTGEQHVSELLPMMDRQVKLMTRLLDDLLDVSRIGRGKIELRKEPIELAQVIHSAIEATRPLIEEMGHVLEVHLPAERVVVNGDPVRLAQVFTNLLNNAAKYMDTGGRIEVNAQREGEHIRVAVVDHGIGIPTDNLSSIFDMFSQIGDSFAKARGGVGIGLFLVKELVEFHHGTVEAHSAGPGQGSEFVVRLPVITGHGVVSTEHVSAAKPSGLKILIVDDNTDAASSLALLLTMTGNEVRTASDGPEALRVASGFMPQVALLDLGMPKMDGYELCRRLRELPGGSEMKAIAVTGWGQEEDRRRTQAAGFDEHMVKPVDVDAMLDMLGGLTPARR